MAKFYGAVGFALSSKEGTGEYEGVVMDDQIIERPYLGDVFRNTRKWENGSDINDNLVINNQISILADAYAHEHCYAMKYVRWMGACWKVTNVEIQRPRLLLTIGDVYNGPTGRPASHPKEFIQGRDQFGTR